MWFAFQDVINGESGIDTACVLVPTNDDNPLPEQMILESIVPSGLNELI